MGSVSKGTSRGRANRGIDINEYAAAFWQRYWELNCASRWRAVTAPSYTRRRAGRETVTLHPVDAAQYPLYTGRFLTD